MHLVDRIARRHLRARDAVGAVALAAALRDDPIESRILDSACQALPAQATRPSRSLGGARAVCSSVSRYFTRSFAASARGTIAGSSNCRSPSASIILCFASLPNGLADTIIRSSQSAGCAGIGEDPTALLDGGRLASSGARARRLSGDARNRQERKGRDSNPRDGSTPPNGFQDLGQSGATARERRGFRASRRDA